MGPRGPNYVQGPRPKIRSSSSTSVIAGLGTDFLFTQFTVQRIQSNLSAAATTILGDEEGSAPAEAMDKLCYTNG
ncbi:hypothetical protein S83_030879 [Arachis hypogaea]